MKTKLLNLWLSLRYSMWFIPLLMAGLAIGLSYSMVALDTAVQNHARPRMAWFYTGGPEGARAVLATIAGSTITVAGVVISMTMVVLTLTASQFGPRLLRNFMRDRVTQTVLGAFVATFLYCLLVLRTVQSLSENGFVPHIALTVGVMLAMGSIGVLIYFMHHVSNAMQVEHIITEVSNDILSAMDRLFPETLGDEAPLPKHVRHVADIPADFERTACPVTAHGSGYVQAIDDNRLFKIATEHDLLLQLRHRPGDFVIRGRALAQVWPGDRANAQLAAQINEVFILGAQRTYEQDVLFAVSQLVEIAIRALSPGINDPFTAIRCIDRLGVALCHLAQREIPSPYRYDETDTLRVIAPPVTFAEVTDVAFSQIRHYARSDRTATLCLLKSIAVVAACVCREEDRTALLRQAVMIERGSQTGLSDEWDQQDVEARYQEVVRILEKNGGPQ